jgi:hypothetical protein
LPSGPQRQNQAGTDHPALPPVNAPVQRSHSLPQSAVDCDSSDSSDSEDEHSHPPVRTSSPVKITPSLKTPSVKVPSLKAPSVQVPSLPAPSPKVPSLLAPSLKAPSFLAPSPKVASLPGPSPKVASLPGPSPKVASHPAPSAQSPPFLLPSLSGRGGHTIPIHARNYINTPPITPIFEERYTDFEDLKHFLQYRGPHSEEDEVIVHPSPGEIGDATGWYYVAVGRRVGVFNNW